LVFPYTPQVFGLEVSGLVPFVILELSRLFLGSRGNLLSDQQSVIIFLGLSLISVFMHLFYLIWQSYVVVVDLVIGAFGLVFLIGQVGFGIKLLNGI
jgi:transmembrane protein 216